MKNKHLLLLFFLTLFGGALLNRFWPWSRGGELRAELFRVDTSGAEVLHVMAPGYPAWSLHHGEGEWTLLVDNRPLSLAPHQSAKLFGTAAKVTSLRVIDSNRPDTLGLGPGQRVELSWKAEGQQPRTLYIGRETAAGTWVMLPGQQAAFLAEGSLRRLYAADARMFRSKSMLDWSAASVDSFVLTVGDSLRYRWQHSGPPDSVATWLRAVLPAGEWPFADYFDETRDRELSLACLRLYREEEVLELGLYRWEPPNLPEDIGALRKIAAALAPYVWHSSANPLNYFAGSDTLRVKRLLAGPPPPAVCDTLFHDY